MQQLIAKMFRTAFSNPLLDQQHDGAVFAMPAGRCAFTTDSFVVRPLFFPGGDIGRLAVFGTVNDLAMCGAKPEHLSCGFILEEGLPMEVLWRIVCSMQDAARQAGVQVVTGDTKVVDRGRADGMYINTAGLGRLTHDQVIGPQQIGAGDAVLLSGDIGRHGMAVMAVREGMSFETEIRSDCAPLWEPVRRLLDAGIEIHALRDLTRGGLAAGLVECAQTSGASIEVQRAAIPVREDVRAACELLGMDPIHVANEGRFVAFVPAAEADRALRILAAVPNNPAAVKIGNVSSPTGRIVTMVNEMGVRRIVDLPAGEQLPRIC